MSESTLYWFHCGRCGALFQSAMGTPDGRTCPSCGADPCPGPAETSPPEASASPAGSSADHADASAKPRGKRSPRKRKNPRIMLKLMLGWTLVLACIVFGARRLWRAAPPPRSMNATAPQAPVLDARDHEFLNSAGPPCRAAFQGFLNAGTPEARNQFVLSPITTAARMARFYSLNPLANIRPDMLSLSASGLVRLPDGDAFEALWQSSDGRVFDTHFRKQDNEWRLDWEHFARYSDYPWALFLAGSGPDEGEFRLLARERLAEERKNEPDISIVLYAPRFGMPAEAGFQSPEFLIPRSTVDGQRLDAAFKLAREGRKVFGASMADINPDGLIRVRVKARRCETQDERSFEITAIKACHWYSVDDPGVEPTPPQPASAGGD